MSTKIMSKILITLFVGVSFLAPDHAVAQTVFDNVTIHTMTAKGTIRRGRVIVEGDRIAAVGTTANLSIPPGAIVIDGTDRHLVPGLTEMHGHIPPLAGDRQDVEDVLFLYVARGVTTVRGMLGSPGQLGLKDQIASKQIMGPTLYLAGPSFSGSSVSSPAQAYERASHQAAEGWDLIKVHPGLTLAEYDAMVDAARTSSIRFAGHVPADVGIEHALDAGQDTIEHMDGYLIWAGAQERPLTEAEMDRAAEMTLAAGAGIVPTNSIWQNLVAPRPLEHYLSFDELKYMPVEVRSSWIRRHADFLKGARENPNMAKHLDENRTKLLGGLWQRGVTVLMGSDAPQLFSVPGFSIHREISMMALAGMTPEAILLAGTVNPGQYFSGEDAFGAIQPGHRADLILLDADPMASSVNLGQQTGVMARGMWLSAGEIKARLDEIAQRNANP